MNLKLEYLSALEIGKLVNDKKLTPKEVLDYFIDRINNYNNSVNAFVYTKFDYAYKEAEKLQKGLIRANTVDCLPAFLLL